MYGPVKSLLFRMDPERAHHAVLAGLRQVHRSRLVHQTLAPRHDARLAVDAMGIAFPGPLGMAAGFDKGAECYNALFGLGFAHVEVGTVTPRPQPGNDGLRMERLPELRAVVNRLGFPGPGCDAVANRMRRHPPAGVAGGNIGPNKDTPAAEVARDLAVCAAQLAPHVRFLTVNVSSPNTPGLRELQTPEAIARLVGATLQAADDARQPRPVLVKLHPDASDGDLVAAAQAALDAGAAGVVATNTTRARPAGSERAIEGGLSGAPLAARARAAIAALHRAVGDRATIVGVGGIMDARDAVAHLEAGADLLQGYTGFVYGGPSWPRAIHKGILRELDRRGLDKVTELRS